MLFRPPILSKNLGAVRGGGGGWTDPPPPTTPALAPNPGDALQRLESKNVLFASTYSNGDISFSLFSFFWGCTVADEDDAS